MSTDALGDGAPQCAVEPRYPGLNIEPAEAARSVRIMNAARAIILPALGLPAD